MPTPDALLATLQARLQQQLEHETLVLPSLPEVALKVQKLAADPNSSMKEIADAIAQDPAIAGQMLRLAQTLRYSHPQNRVTTLPDAIIRVGLRGTMNVMLSLAVSQLFIFQSPLICQLCREQQHRSGHISRFALTLFDEWKARSAQDADFIMLAAVLLEVGSLPLLAELDRLSASSLPLPESALLREWCDTIRVPMGQAIIHKWQLNPIFAALMPLDGNEGTSPAERALQQARRYYQLQQDQQSPRLQIPVTIEQGMSPLPSGREREQLLAWSKSYNDGLLPLQV